MRIITNEEKMKSNIKLYTKYKMFAYDVLFFYAVSILYFTIAKGLDMSQIVFLSGIFALFSIVWHIVADIIVEKLGLKKSLVLGNFIVVLMIFLLIIGNGFIFLLIAEIIGALGYCIKGISENAILYESLANINHKQEFAKYEGLASSRYLLFDAIAALIAGYVFLINPYIPMLLCLVCVIIGFILSLKFYPTENSEFKHVNLNEYIQNFKLVLQSQRSRAVLLFAFLISGIIGICFTLFQAIILEFNITSDVLAFIICGYSVVMSISSRYSYEFEQITKNKTLIILLIVFCLMIGLIALMGLTQVHNVSILIVMIACIAVMALIQGVYEVLIKKYVTSFTNSEVITKMTSLYYVIENIGLTAFLFISSILLIYFSNSITTLLIVCLALVIGISIYGYSNTRLGLKPEQYDRKDINNIDIREEE